MFKKRVIVVDDEPMISILTKEFIEEDEEWEISSITTEKAEFLDLILNNPYDVALIDISIGGCEGGLEILRTLKNKKIDVPCIILSAHDEIDYAPKCLQAGAKGYVNKNYICTDLLRALNEVNSGQLFVSGSNGKYILNRYKINAPACQ